MATVDAKQGLGPARWQRHLLPGTMVDGPGARRSLRDWVVDAIVTVFALGLGTIALHSTWPEHGGLLRFIDVVLGLGSVAALWDRRRHPLGVAALVIPLSAISALAAGAALVALFNAAIRSDRRTLAWLALATVSASIFNSVIYAEDDFWVAVVFSFLAVAVTVGWGLFVRVRHDLVESLHERNARLEEEGRLRAEQARAGERERIAREMHDVLAHRLSLLSLHAGALEFRPEAPPEEISATAGVVREAAAAALEELRDVIGVLREGTDGESRPPQPTLADLPALIEESRAAGMAIEAELELPETAGASTGRTAYRVVQEGLTNARKHAPGLLVRARVTASEETLEIEIRNPIPLMAPPAATLPGAGSGLVGLGERVRLAEGELRHEVSMGSEFVLQATLPRER